MSRLRISPLGCCAFIAAWMLAPAANSAEHGPGPCKQIVEACKSAGFVSGDYKQGYGLWVDCVHPILRGTTPPANTDKPLPSVDSSLIAACKAKNPNFGERNKNAPKE